MKRLALLLAVGAAMACLHAVAGFWSAVARSPLLFLCLQGLQFGLFAVAVWSFRRTPLPGRWRLVVLFGLALTLRGVLFFSQPLFDNDLYRYRWDGKVLGQGINPYRYSPDARELAWLRDRLDERVEYAYIPTVYPPLSQAAFWLGWRLDPHGLLGLKAVVLVCDLLTLVVVVLLLRALALPVENAAFYAWHPLVLKELTNSGHQDAFGIFLFVLFAYLLVCRRGWAATVALTLSGLTKLLPFAYFALTWRRLRARHYLLALLLAALTYLPFATALDGICEGLGTYRRYWEFNAGLFGLVRLAVSSVAADPFQCAQLVVLLAAGGIGAYLAWWTCMRRHKDDGCALLSGLTALTVALLLLSPTVNPSYVCWLVPLLCLVPLPAGVAFTGTVTLSYVYHVAAREHWWVQALEYAPVFGLLVWQWWSKRRGRSR